MTEEEWHSCTDTTRMLRYLWTCGRTAHRNYELLAVAWSRRIWPRLNKKTHRVIEVAERFADDLASRDEMEATVRDSRAIRGWDEERDLSTWLRIRRLLRQGRHSVADVSEATVLLLAEAAMGGPAWDMESETNDWVSSLARLVKALQRRNERKSCCVLVRDIWGNPFGPMPPINRSYLGWNGSTILKLATVIYDENRFADMPVLADALEDAGCEDERILRHCREQGIHVRGCWLLDAILAKQ